jgi:hypothetical protein
LRFDLDPIHRSSAPTRRTTAHSLRAAEATTAMTNESTPETSPIDRAAWGGRFGWIVGASIGLGLGFFAAYALETVALKGRADATAVATRLTSVVVPACFLVGAIGGHQLGARRGERWYKALGVAAGITLLTIVWVLLSIAR